MDEGARCAEAGVLGPSEVSSVALGRSGLDTAIERSLTPFSLGQGPRNLDQHMRLSRPPSPTCHGHFPKLPPSINISLPSLDQSSYLRRRTRRMRTPMRWL